MSTDPKPTPAKVTSSHLHLMIGINSATTDVEAIQLLADSEAQATFHRDVRIAELRIANEAANKIIGQQADEAKGFVDALASRDALIEGLRAFEAFVQKHGDYRKAFDRRMSTLTPETASADKKGAAT